MSCPNADRAPRFVSSPYLVLAEMPTENPPTLARIVAPPGQDFPQLLREATEAAIEVDKERGCYPDGRAEITEDVTAQVEQDVCGPAGERAGRGDETADQ